MFHLAAEDNQKLQEKVSEKQFPKKKSRFVQIRNRSSLGAPTDVEMIRDGTYATQNPRGPPSMRMRIFDGEEDTTLNDKAYEEAEASVAAQIQEELETQAQEMAAQSLNEQRDRSLRNEAFTIENTINAISNEEQAKLARKGFAPEIKNPALLHIEKIAIPSPSKKMLSSKGESGELPCAKSFRFLGRSN